MAAFHVFLSRALAPALPVAKFSSEPSSLAAMRRRDEQEELMALVDTDGDDCIDLEEFIAVCGGEPVFASNAVRCNNGPLVEVAVAVPLQPTTRHLCLVTHVCET